MPTNKWIAARVTGVAALLTMWATTGTWDTEETVAAIGLLSEGAISWLTKNYPPVIDPVDPERGQSTVELLLICTFVGVLLLLFGVSFH